MRIEKWNLTEGGRVNITYYLHDVVEDLPKYKERPMIIVCPGGGYTHLSNREGDPIALAFMSKGFHVAVLKYSINEFATFPNSLIDLSKAVKYTREKSMDFGINPNQIAVCGFSAGGHVVATFGTLWHSEFVKSLTETEGDENKPNALILGYPVITTKWINSREFTDVFLGGDTSTEKIKLISADENVSQNTPPTFIFHSFEDGTVPVSDSLAFATALEKEKIPFELHIFEKGIHGFALGNKLTQINKEQCMDGHAEIWIDLCCKWIWDKFGDNF